MKNYFLLKVTKGENVFFEVHETEEQAIRTAEQYYHFTPSKIIVEIKEVKETRPIFHKSKG
jgi:hypothetical protein